MFNDVIEHATKECQKINETVFHSNMWKHASLVVDPISQSCRITISTVLDGVNQAPHATIAYYELGGEVKSTIIGHA